ncbi:Hypothetical predicted protein [Olea europaea subsp. europaea]|uniref:Uncharacterized protein n=1 Tax=Olea europaea subsp. europaea TaxID=158383 RepID=A0A8S0PHB6_OLEEU|nr:Hypothetical predicted protein [Olea europaea subsp. europaea]
MAQRCVAGAEAVEKSEEKGSGVEDGVDCWAEQPEVDCSVRFWLEQGREENKQPAVDLEEVLNEGIVVLMGCQKWRGSGAQGGAEVGYGRVGWLSRENTSTSPSRV